MRLLGRKRKEVHQMCDVNRIQWIGFGKWPNIYYRDWLVYCWKLRFVTDFQYWILANCLLSMNLEHCFDWQLKAAVELINAGYDGNDNRRKNATNERGRMIEMFRKELKRPTDIYCAVDYINESRIGRWMGR